MRKFLVSGFIIVAISAFNEMPVYAVETQQPEVREKAAFVKDNDLATVLGAIKKEGWKVPYIPSQWHMENVAPEEKREEMTQARKFGKILAGRLAEWALKMISASGAEENERISRMFLELGDWVSETQGYGNLVLAARCYDITTPGIGRLIVNTDYPLKKVNELLEYFDAPWYAPSIRMNVLNQEAGVELFKSGSQEEEDIQKALRKTWLYGNLALMIQEDPGIEAALKGNPREDLIDYALMMRGAHINFEKLKSTILQDNVNYFVDDERPSSMFGIVDMWDVKWHHLLVVGWKMQNITKLKALTTFRSKIGSFPKDSTKEWFYHEWEPYAKNDTSRVDVRAWLAYKNLEKGMFLDKESRWAMLNRKQKDK